MNTLIKHYIWSWVWLGLWLRLGLTLALLITMITQHYRHIITHFKYVHNVLSEDTLNKLLSRKYKTKSRGEVTYR